MNGYFNNLAIRTVNQGTLVQPRMASVYETATSSLATDQTDERGSVTSHQAVASHAVRSPVAVAADTPFVPSRVDASPLPVNVVETATESFFEPTVSHEQPAPQPGEPEVRVTRAVPAQTTQVLSGSPAAVNEVLVHEDTTTVVIPETPATTATTPTRNTIVQQTRPAPAIPAPSAATPKLPASTAPAAEVEQSINSPQPERSAVPSVKSVFHETETTRSTHHFSERLSQQTKTRREQLLLESSSDPEPAINVTIGRVEVRATPTPSAKQKPLRTASPVMPLEEYLRKQRRGDER